MHINIINQSINSLPTHATEQSAGVDLRAYLTQPVSLAPLERALISTGFSIALPVGYEAQIRPRSGLSLHHGIHVVLGTIDSDYRGEIKVLLFNLSQKNFTIQNNERIAQMVIAKHEKIQWNLVTTLNDTDRGKKGFGSTGSI